MKNIIRITCLLLALSSVSTFANLKLTKDIDFDGKKDKIFIDKKTSTLVCLLSSRNFARYESQPLEFLLEATDIKPAKNGFYLDVNFMRAGYSNQFRYDKKRKKLRLIGMSHYEFGNASHDGSGESSVNLLTGDYIGDWHYCDYQKEKLIKIPTIKTKMKFNKIYLEDFNDDTYFNFAERDATLYENQRAKMIQRRK